MDAVLNNLFSNFFFYFGTLVSGIAALSFLVYLRGFIAGVGHVFDDGAHVDHQEHAEVRMVWGVMLLVVIFIFWEIVRALAHLL